MVYTYHGNVNEDRQVGELHMEKKEEGLKIADSRTITGDLIMHVACCSLLHKTMYSKEGCSMQPKH